MDYNEKYKIYTSAVSDDTMFYDCINKLKKSSNYDVDIVNFTEWIVSSPATFNLLKIYLDNNDNSKLPEDIYMINKNQMRNSIIIIKIRGIINNDYNKKKYLS